jgi:hypothetical protein
MSSYELTTQEEILIHKILARAWDLGFTADSTSSMMDLIMVHNNVYNLDLKKFLESNIVTFSHDFCGITIHLSRDSLEPSLDGFIPKCAIVPFPKK